MQEVQKAVPAKKKRRIVMAAAVILLGVFVVPPAVLLMVLYQHVDYRGEESLLYPLQGIYTAEMFGLEETVHTFQTQDGESVWCAEVPMEQPEGVVIFLSGITQPSVTYFYGHAAWLREQGFASFLLEVRAHGNSTGELIGLGYTEVAEVRAVMEHIKIQPAYQGVPVIIWGVSMGGAIALNAFGQIPAIDACIAMSPYASFRDEIDLQMQRLWMPAPVRGIELFMLDHILERIYGSGAVAELSPKKQIQNANGRPVLLLACAKDATVPVENAYMLQEAAPEAELWVRDSWEHFVIQDCDFTNVEDDTEYCSRVMAWLSEAVREPA